MRKCFLILWSLLYSYGLHADIVILNDDTVIQGKITAQNNQEITMEVYEIRTKAQVFSKPNFVFREKKKDWKSEIISQDLLYFSGKPLLPYAKINLSLVKEKAILPKSEIHWTNGQIQEYDFYQKTNTHIYYYDLGSKETLEWEEKLNNNNLKVKEDVSGVDGYIPETHRMALQKKPLSEVKSIYLINADGKTKIFPERKDWFSDGLLGITYNLLVPTGQIASLPISPLGFLLSGSYQFALGNIWPSIFKTNFRLRLGLAAGWQRLLYETVYSTTDIHLFPVLAQISLVYDIPRYFGPLQISPLLRLSQGAIISQVTKKLKDEFHALLAEESQQKKQTYVGSASLFSLGFAFSLHKYPRYLYTLDVGYLYHAEKLAGTFLAIQFSFGYLL